MTDFLPTGGPRPEFTVRHPFHPAPKNSQVCIFIYLGRYKATFLVLRNFICLLISWDASGALVLFLPKIKIPLRCSQIFFLLPLIPVSA